MSICKTFLRKRLISAYLVLLKANKFIQDDFKERKKVRMKSTALQKQHLVYVDFSAF